MWEDALHNLANEPIGLIVALVLYLVFGVVPGTAAVYLIYFLLTLPMRRAERARVFLDLLELGLKEGRTPEQAIQQAASCSDPMLGFDFRRLAAVLAMGLRLPEALAKVPRLVPAQVVAMLGAGQRLGDLKLVLPACRQLLADAVSQTRAGLNYVIILCFLATPFIVAVPAFLMVKVLPAYREVFAGMTEGALLPAFTRMVLNHFNLVMLGLCVLLAAVWGVAIAYVGGPRIHRWLRRLAPGLVDWVMERLPWRRARLRRDFSTVLALLLDAGVPEAEAVTLAGECTSNLRVAGRAAQVVDLLRKGTPLPEAITRIDPARELGWRLGNALRRGSGFTRALKGWQESLDARAFQLEQGATQVATTVLVLVNGAVVGIFVIGMFLALVSLIQMAALW